MRQWFTMLATEGAAEISIYDEIGRSFWDDSAVSAKSFIDQLEGLGDVSTIALHINSPGGDVFDGVAIHNALKNHKAKVTAHVDGIAASIASYIAMAADRIIMPANSFMLLHNASGFVMGTAEEMRSVADDLDRIDKSISATYASRSGQKPSAVAKLLKEDRLMDAKEAKSLGYADEVTADVKMAANYPLRLLPEAAATKLRSMTGSMPLPEPAAQVPGTPSPSPAPTPLPAAAQLTVPEPKGADILNFTQAKQQGMEEHRDYVSSVIDLCTLATMPERVGAYVRAQTPVEQVRKELLDLRAAAAREPPLLPQHPLVPQKTPESLWGKITDKLNARKKGA
jgi:ATP-dependent protease ClpP protease subunit